MESTVSGLELRARRHLHWQREKLVLVDQALATTPVDIEALRKHTTSLGGLFHTRMRKKVWPKLVGVNIYAIGAYSGPSLVGHKDRAQVLLDVNRCIKRIPAHYSETKKRETQDQLLRVILRLLSENNELYYYQGFHDIVITFLLVGGEDFAFSIMNVLVKHHLRDFMDVNMNRTKMIISYISPLLRLESPELETFITKSECAYYFSLSWLITWFGHVVRSPDEAFRLVDFFLAAHPLMPIYMAGAIILTREAEVLSTECEMSAVHGLLSALPDTLRYEQMIVLACRLFEKHSPKRLAQYGGLKISASSLISTYHTFARSTHYQLPDHTLSRGVPAPSPPPWWTDWLPTLPSLSLLLRLIAVVTPVLLALVVVQLFSRTSSSASVDTVPAPRVGRTIPL